MFVEKDGIKKEVEDIILSDYLIAGWKKVEEKEEPTKRSIGNIVKESRNK